MTQSNKRRSIPVVDKAFQYKYTAMIVCIVVAISGVLGYLLLQSYWETNRIMDLAVVSSEFGDQVNRDDARSVLYISLAILVFEMVLLGVMGLIITHRVCGPVYVIHRDLRIMLDGKYPRAHMIRQDDEFRETFKMFMAVVASLKKRDADEVEKLNHVIAAARQKGVPDSVVATLEQLVAERRFRVSSSGDGYAAGLSQPAGAQITI
jgi:hypothetical protein